MSNNWPNAYGEGRRRCGPVQSGIPENKPLWHRLICNEGTDQFFPIIFGDIIVHHNNRDELVAIDKWSGDLLWQNNYLKNNYIDLIHLGNIDSDFLLIGPRLFSSPTGEIVIDLFEHPKFSQSSLNLKSVKKVGNLIIQSLTTKENESIYITYDLKNHEYNEIKLPFGQSTNFIDDTYARNFDGKKLTYFEWLTGKTLWVLKQQIIGDHLEFQFDEEALYLSDLSNFYKIDRNSGECLWQADFALYHEELNKNSTITTKAISKSVIVIETEQQYVGLSNLDGKKMWESPKFLKASGLCVAGDLAFVQDYRRRLVALDLYDGREVWSVSDTKYAEGSVKVIEGMVLIESMGGYELYSYSWDKDNHYHSPVKSNF